jgi:hypothetical protein
MIIFLFSLNFYDFWSILIADLLLHDFLHLFIYDAAKTVCLLTSYIRKIATVAQLPLYSWNGLTGASSSCLPAELLTKGTCPQQDLSPVFTGSSL